MNTDYESRLKPIRQRWQARMDDDGWVTIKGTHVLLQNGVAVGGGKLSGMTFSNAKSTKSKSSKNSGANDPGWLKFKEGREDSLAKISQVPVKKLDKKLSDEEIINRVSGGDKTKGSCMSATLTYAANKAGLDVLDFRGGASQDFFCRAVNVNGLEDLGAKVTTVLHSNDYTATHKLLKGADLNKEYILTTGSHAAVVRRTGKKSWEYLELQSHTQSNNGWHELNDERLQNRFGAKKSNGWLYYQVKYEPAHRLIDIDSLGQCGGFSELMSYINTAPANQQKGVGGDMK